MHQTKWRTGIQMTKNFLSVLLILLLSMINLSQAFAKEPVENSAFEKFENTLEQILRPKNDNGRTYDFIRELRRVDGPEAVKSLSSGSVHLLKQLEKNECFSFLNAAILKPLNFFDPVEPEIEFKYTGSPVMFRDFATCAAAQGWRQYSLGGKEEAFNIFCNLVQFGAMFSKKGGVSNHVYGSTICFRGINQLEVFFNLNPEPTWKKNIQAALNNLTRPVIDFTGLLAFERKKIQWNFAYIRQNLDSWKKRKDIPWLAEGASPEQKCSANQIILQCAIVITAIEGYVVEKREIKNAEQLRKEILKATSLEEWPVCPSGGYYSIPADMKSLQNLCSIHPTEIPIASGAIRDKDFTFGPMPLELLAIVDTPELEIQEKQALDYLETLSRLAPLEPDAASKAAEIKQQYSFQGAKEKTNLVIKKMLPTDFSMTIKLIKQIQQKIDALM